MVEEHSGNPYYIRVDCLVRLKRLLRDMEGLRGLQGV
jgi:hypothetical protein